VSVRHTQALYQNG